MSVGFSLHSLYWPDKTRLAADGGQFIDLQEVTKENSTT